MMKNIFLVFLIGLSVVGAGYGCKSSSQAKGANSNKEMSTSDQEKYKKVAEETLKSKELEYIHDASKRFVLCVKKEKDKKNMIFVHFLLYDTKEQKAVCEKNLGIGNVQWINDQEIEYYSMPGILPQGKTIAHYTTICDATSGSCRPKAAQNVDLRDK